MIEFPQTDGPRRLPRSLAALLLLMAADLGCSRGSEETAASAAAPGFVGGAVCASCHAPEAERWRGSHHDLAMQEASEATVLGDFENARLSHFGLTSSFFRRDGAFFVRTAGRDGELADFEVAYTFGAEPLQQYLVRLDDGRLQALSLAWDTRAPAEGGQRWFDLHPDEPIPHDDVLHWTGPSQNWNFMCADCHSTGVRKGYDEIADRYQTTWESIDVSCEACHGPGSTHVAWARAAQRPDAPAAGLVVGLRNEARWVFAPGAAIAHREGPAAMGAEIDTCAPCHARRAAIAEERLPGQPFLDSHLPALLDEGLYHADGQILDEVYVWGSFLQSRMFAKGVTCSDCHDPHGLRIEGDPNAACATCHRADVFAATAHHGHAPDSAGSSCVVCHMPQRTYMVVDARRDHSFRVPRPDLTESIGVPNVCSSCHADRSAAWAARTIDEWRRPGVAPGPHYGEALHAGRRGLPGAARALAELAGDPAAPGIVRASALDQLGRSSAPAPVEAVARGAADPDPLVRLGAVDAAARLEPSARLGALLALLRDPVRAVRIEAARVLAGVPPALWPDGARLALADALAEYRAAQRVSADRPEAHVNLGVLHVEFGELEEARREYETAIRLAPHFVPAHLNLADLYRLEGRDDEGERVLLGALERAPENADVQHALGLLRVRQRRLPEALDALDRAAALGPEEPRHAYVYGVALHSAGQSERALAVLGDAHRLHPGDRDILLALASFSRDAGAIDEARAWAARMLALDPEDPRFRALARELGASAPQQ